MTADPVYKEKDYHVGHLTQELSVRCFDLDVQDPRLLLDYDAGPYQRTPSCRPAGTLSPRGNSGLMGGNPYYLLKSIRETQAQAVLARLAQEKLLLGVSAGAVVLGPSLALIDRYTPEMNEWGMKDLTGLCLTGVQLLPHYGRFLIRFDGFEETCRSYEKETGRPVLRLNDGDGILLQGKMEKVIRGEPSPGKKEEP